jgi:uncharacterized protein
MGLLVILLGAALAPPVAYATFFEPQRIEVTRHPFVGNVKKPLRIAHLTDLHTRGLANRERSLIQLVRKESPDLIVITGDTTNGINLGVARDFLVNLSAPLGVWLVRGDSERWSMSDKEISLYGDIRVSFLVNRGAAIRDDIWLAGLDDPTTGTPELDKALQGAPAAAFKLVLMHSPDHFPRIAGRFDLALAGHSHGGQIVLPGYGPMVLPPGGRRYVRGWFTQNRSHLFVNRGLGTARIPARLFARPELAIIEIRPR